MVLRAPHHTCMKEDTNKQHRLPRIRRRRQKQEQQQQQQQQVEMKYDDRQDDIPTVIYIPVIMEGLAGVGAVMSRNENVKVNQGQHRQHIITTNKDDVAVSSHNSNGGVATARIVMQFPPTKKRRLSY